MFAGTERSQFRTIPDPVAAILHVGEPIRSRKLHFRKDPVLNAFYTEPNKTTGALNYSLKTVLYTYIILTYPIPVFYSKAY